MPEKSKKLRLYKFASEYNLSTDALVDFLKEKGYTVKGHMALLTDEMLSDIYDKFKKDIERAENHYKKIDEFHKRYSDKAPEKEEESETSVEEEVVEEPAEEETASQDAEPATDDEGDANEEVVSDPEPEEVVEEQEPDVAEIEAEEEITEESAEVEEVPDEPAPETEVVEVVIDEPAEVEEVAETTEEEPVEETVEESPIQEKAETVVEPEIEEPAESVAETEVEEDDGEAQPFKTKSELEIENRRRGLKIVGKIDLNAGRKKKQAKKQTDEKKEDQSKAGQEQKSGKRIVRLDQGTPENNKKQDPAQGTPEGDDASKKGKKKKVLKSKKKDEKVEETPKGKKKRKGKKFEVDKSEVEAAIKRTMLSMDDSSGSSDRSSARKKKKKERLEEKEKIIEQQELEGLTKIQVTEFIAVNELANLMNVSVSDVISKCIGMGLMVSINQRLDNETITLVADEFGFEVEFEEEYKSDALDDYEDDADTLTERSPVVTIMGHVDHGKTSLLDYVRRANVVAGEAGGITQHIGAYKVEVSNGRSIAFLDTPGHEAFTAMRARGAKVTDIVVLIVAADDAVMPQTVEAINHAQAAGVPIVVAINKIDKPNANIEKIRQQLAERNILVEDWGGKYQSAEISAKQGLNIDDLLDKILLEAEILDLKANADRAARGTVIESQLDKGRGITATVLVQKGTLKIGDPFVAGNFHGRVRAMLDERDKKVDEAGPSTPVLVLGFEGTPQSGDNFVVVSSEREAREVALKRQQLKREQDHRQVRHITLDEIASQISTGGVKELGIVVKGDVDGSVEALADSLMKLSTQEVKVQVIHRGVGAITEGDVLLAAASEAIIVGFHVRPNTNARKLAETEHVDIRLYNVIYDAINEVKSALEGMLDPVLSEQLVATIEVRDTFKVPKVGTIAGCYVQDGKINRNDKIRLFRDGIVTYEGELATLKRFKDDVKEVDAGYECGLNIQNFNDIKVGDIIEAYKIISTKKKLD
ncbi:MAG: translation initiation factor IF-2 [Melioribacteraceae bacterium]|nr:MAG: translation initiation factor IF-2 [Melioribacteraceae bacterium]